MLDIGSLYNRMYGAMDDGDDKLAEFLREQIDARLSGRVTSASSFLPRFIDSIKNKKCYDVYKEIIAGKKINEIELAVEVSSLITQSLIAVESISLEGYEYLNIDGQVNLLSSILGGKSTNEDFIEFYTKILS